MALRIVFFKCRNALGLFQRQANVIKAVEQAMFAEGIYVELDHTAVWSADFLRHQINCDCGIGAASGVVHEQLQLVRRYDNRQNAVLETVVVEDVGKACRDDTADAKIQQGPGRVFTAGAATEIVPGHQDFGFAIGLLVENKFWQFHAFLGVAHFIKQGFAQSRAQNGFQELLGNDHVGVDIDDIEGGCNTGQGFKFLHDLFLQIRHPSPFGEGQGWGGAALPLLKFLFWPEGPTPAPPQTGRGEEKGFLRHQVYAFRFIGADHQVEVLHGSA